MAFSPEKIKKRAEELKKNNGYEKSAGEDQKKPWGKLKEVGTHTFRIIPDPKMPEDQPFEKMEVYWLTGCPAFLAPNKGEKDVVRDYRFELFEANKVLKLAFDEAGGEYDEKKVPQRSDDPAVEEIRVKLQANFELFRKLNSTPSYIATIIDREDEASGTQMMSMTKNDHEAMCELFQQKGVGDYTDLKKGFDVVVAVSVSDKIMPGQKKPSLTRKFSLDTLERGRSAAHEDELVVQAWQKDIKQPSEYYKLATEAESQKFLDKFLASYGASVVAASATQKTAEKPVEKVAEKPVTEKVEKKTSKKKEEKVSIEETEASLEDQFSDFKDDEDV